ncbi:hypothetical protein VP1G_05674 [Cytospora mali]|uniref:Putative gamma-glutamylcyclotransferase n=1 Tax=Cytospora mali TaxID=578113 RepID=A0A194V342_CYTMA|nr:hypothetical protein VP1G_05674 [Valsa mali var. pyri (nom. inval.)]
MAEQVGNLSYAHEETIEHVRQEYSQPLASSTTPSTARAEAGRRKLMLEKFLAADEDDSDLEEFHRKAGIALAEENARAREAKELYFFYGSLMFPRMLQHVLDLHELPELKPAEVVGLHLKMWGPYPALVNGESGEVVRGMAYEVESGEQKDKLARYETECYRTRKFYISVLGEEKVLGTTFVWNGDSDGLDEGTFDVKSWEERMSRILDC